MKCQIALDPALEVSAVDFADAWNADPPVADVSASVFATASGSETASVSASEPVSFLSPEITVALVAAAASIPATVVANFISDYLKKKFIDKDDPKVTVTTISTPDGKPLLVVKQSEE